MDICINCVHCKEWHDYMGPTHFTCQKSLISIDPVTGYHRYKECEQVRVPVRVPKCDMFERKQSWITKLFQ